MMARSDQAYVQPKAAWAVTLGGKDLTEKLAPRLVSLVLTEKRGEEADTVELTLHDADGALQLPPEGAVLAVAMGWERGTGVAQGLVAKGTFKVDELTWSGPPDVVTITARAADLRASFRKRKTRIWKDKTLGQIVGQIAAEHDLAARCHADLSGTAVTMAEQNNKSDMTFLRDLGRRYDAIATVKNKSLIFAPVDADTTATGKPVPTATVTRKSGDRYEYRRAGRERHEDGAEADWHDHHHAKRKKVHHGGANRRKLKRVYASEADAKAATKSEARRLKRAEATLTISLAYGDAALAPGMKLTASGFKTEVDAKAWRVASATHRMDAGGFVTELEMETAG